MPSSGRRGSDVRTGALLSDGVETHTIEGVRVKVFNIAKTVADCFRHRRSVGLRIALEGLQEALRQRKVTPGAMSRQAAKSGVATVMRPYLEARTEAPMLFLGSGFFASGTGGQRLEIGAHPGLQRSELRPERRRAAARRQRAPRNAFRHLPRQQLPCAGPITEQCIGHGCSPARYHFNQSPARMAVGARRADILQQFLTEALLICMIGGAPGVLLALGLVWPFRFSARPSSSHSLQARSSPHSRAPR